ncbi:hypothetical protein [Streptomyces sp. NPDC057686]|uniref:hypothetical protein n=1 Tax=Streptomyces sp. NPDC057686 TaxID=3346212 RepID=UPI00369EDA38
MRLRWVFYMSAQVAMMMPGPSLEYYRYRKERREGLIHTQALGAFPWIVDILITGS